jgi:hypothetical protein
MAQIVMPIRPVESWDVQVKGTLARLHPENLDTYYEVKDPVCDIIMAAAERWASEMSYAPGLSDL